jgi:hypothetical protein
MTYILIYLVIFFIFNNNTFIILVLINLAFSCIFVLELIIRITALGFHFFRRFWNVYDFVIITISAVSFIYGFTSGDTQSSFASFINVIEVLRILRVIKKIPYLKRLFTVLYVVLPQVANIAVLLFTVILIYGVLGVELFAYLKKQSSVGGENIHFRSPFISMMNLVRCLTGESWYLQLADCARENQPNFVCFNVDSYSDYLKYGLLIFNLLYLTYFLLKFNRIKWMWETNRSIYFLCFIYCCCDFDYSKFVCCDHFNNYRRTHKNRRTFC